ncbi:tail fiber assembly protein [Pseudomonas sp. W5-01]|uniref:tail fiber assembly protein n=1 Tax=Pseudomonas sp. W5-01 TaxID=3097454 RepID=UPI00397D259B
MTEGKESLMPPAVEAPVGRWWEQDGVFAPTVCHVSPLTGEFMGMGVADPSPLEPGVWLMPAHTYQGEAPIVFPGCAAVRGGADGMWHQVPDYRGKTVYDKDTRAASKHQELGELPELFTLSAPSSDFDVWQGGQWVLDVAAKNAALTNRAGLKKALLAQCAGGVISTLQYAVDNGIADEAEIELLDAWRTYTVTLSRVAPGPEVVWPNSPDDPATAAFLQSRGYEDVAV